MTDEARRRRALDEVRPYVQRARTFSGWNFDDLGVTDIGPTPPWDYVALARECAAQAARTVDFGTGGGEVYARIVAGQRGRFVASEEWHVNAPVARDLLRPPGVEVLRAQSERPPFGDATFDLALSRHEAIDPREVARILRPGGVCVTQQVGNRQWQELAAFFPVRQTWPDHYVEYRRAFEEAGLEVTSQEHAWQAAYPGIGAIAFMLLVAPWEVPGFDAERDIDALMALEDARRTERGIVLTLDRYLMEARKA